MGRCAAAWAFVRGAAQLGAQVGIAGGLEFKAICMAICRAGFPALARLTLAGIGAAVVMGAPWCAVPRRALA